MSTSYERSDNQQFDYASRRTGRDATFGAVFSDERIGRPIGKRRRHNLPWGGIITGITTGISLIFFQTGNGTTNWLIDPPQQASPARAQLLAAPQNQRLPAPVPEGDAHAGLSETPASQPSGVRVIATVPPPRAIEPQPEKPLPPPKVDKNDPYQARALAAGLHPGLSRALLAQLSPADFRHAAYAVRTALAKTPDDKIFVWPRRRRVGQVRFRVGFVRGVGQDCRRYVVQVIKDGWTTTARPMEKCGLPPPRVKTARSRQKTISR